MKSLIIITNLFCFVLSNDISKNVFYFRDLRPHVPMENLFRNDFWGTPMNKEQSHKSYRPLTVLTFRLNYLVHELAPLGYHLVNLCLHTAVSLLYHSLCCSLLSKPAAALAALLFAVHPVHTEAVTGVVGRAELLASLFFLYALLRYQRLSADRRSVGWKGLMLVAALVSMSMLCKEQGITVIAVCTLHEIFVNHKLSLRDIVVFSQVITSGGSGSKGSLLPATMRHSGQRIAFLAVTGVVLMLFRLRIMGSQLPVFTKFDNPAAVADMPARQLTFNYLIAVNSKLLMSPVDLCCDWTMNTIPLVQSLGDPRNLATIVVFTLLGHLGYRGLLTNPHPESSVILTGLGLLVFPFIPASNLLFPVGFVVAERVLYLPSMGFCLLVAFGCDKMFRRKGGIWRYLAIIGVTILLASHSCKTVLRNQDWTNEYALFKSGLKVNSGNAKLFNNVGHALEGQGKYEMALGYFNAAVTVQPDDIGAHINVGRTYNHMTKFDEAEEAYLKAKSLLPRPKPGETYQARVAPNHLNVFLSLATLISKNGSRLEEADLLYRQAISMRSDYTQAYINRGDILLKLNRTKEAQEVYERALFYDNTNPDIYYNLGVVLIEQGRHSQALAYLNKALELDPDHNQALLNSAMLIQETGSSHLRHLAIDRLHRMVDKGHTNERVFFNLGMLSMDEGDAVHAELWFRKAIELKYDFRSALFNLALLLSDNNRPLEAAPFLNQLIKYYPTHTKGLILLGDIYINHLRDLDAAEDCYTKILDMDPKNVQAMHNRCVVMVERGQLGQARTCLQQAHALAPHEDYIKKHLDIVESKLKEAKPREKKTK